LEGKSEERGASSLIKGSFFTAGSDEGKRSFCGWQEGPYERNYDWKNLLQKSTSRRPRTADIGKSCLKGKKSKKHKILSISKAYHEVSLLRNFKKPTQRQRREKRGRGREGPRRPKKNHLREKIRGGTKIEVTRAFTSLLLRSGKRGLLLPKVGREGREGYKPRALRSGKILPSILKKRETKQKQGEQGGPHIGRGEDRSTKYTRWQTRAAVQASGNSMYPPPP